MRLVKFLPFVTLGGLLAAIPAQAGFWDDLFGIGDKSTTTPIPTPTPTPAPTSSIIDSIVNLPSSPLGPNIIPTTVPVFPSNSLIFPSVVIPSALPSLIVSSSSVIPPSSSATTTPTPAPTPTQSSTTSSKHSSSSSSSSSASASSSVLASEKDSGNSSSNKTAIIAGTVCAIISVIFAGIGYAFFVKTRRNNREARLYGKDNTSDMDQLATGGGGIGGHSNIMPHSGYAAQDDIYGGNGTQNQYHQYQYDDLGYSTQYNNNGNMNGADLRYVPQSPMVGMQDNQQQQQWDSYAAQPAMYNSPQYPQSAHYYDPSYTQAYNNSGQYIDPNQYQSYTSSVPIPVSAVSAVSAAVATAAVASIPTATNTAAAAATTAAVSDAAAAGGYSRPNAYDGHDKTLETQRYSPSSSTSPSPVPPPPPSATPTTPTISANPNPNTNLNATTMPSYQQNHDTSYNYRQDW